MELHNHKCTACNIVWAKLLTVTEEESTYDVCPECKSDINLVESFEQGFIKNPLTGKVADVYGKVLPVKPPAARRTYVSPEDKFLIGRIVGYSKLGSQAERDERADRIIEQHINSK